MSGAPGPVLEISHCVDPEVIQAFDAWLPGYIAALIDVVGVDHVDVYRADADVPDWPQRVVHCRFDNPSNLDNYLADRDAATLEATAAHFGEAVALSTRILYEAEALSSEPEELCLNCGTPLTGQYCGTCGQRARSRLISIWELLQEAFGDVFELDSRLWRTLIPLAVKPGSLTRDYLEGRRARFMPPFRTYLVLSIVFFLVAFFDPREQFSIFFEPEEAAAPEPAEPVAAPTADDIQPQVFDELTEEGIMPPRDSGFGSAGATAPGEEDADEQQNASSRGFNVRFGDGDTESSARCDNVEIENAPPWVASRLTPERLKLICERTTADGGAAFVAKILDNTPAALFFLLPLMALILKVLYPLSKRYYVEHLLFVVHFHAFVFLMLIVQTLLNRVVAAAALPEWIAAIGVAVVLFYVPTYLYKALRRVYSQGHVLSSLKFLVLSMSYLIGLSLIFAITVIISAFSM